MRLLGPAVVSDPTGTIVLTALSTRGSGIGVLAATVDYTIVLKRLTPDWALVLSKISMGVVPVAVASRRIVR